MLGIVLSVPCVAVPWIRSWRKSSSGPSDLPSWAALNLWVCWLDFCAPHASRQFTDFLIFRSACIPKGSDCGILGQLRGHALFLHCPTRQVYRTEWYLRAQRRSCGDVPADTSLFLQVCALVVHVLFWVSFPCLSFFSFSFPPSDVCATRHLALQLPYYSCHSLAAISLCPTANLGENSYGRWAGLHDSHSGNVVHFGECALSLFSSPRHMLTYFCQWQVFPHYSYPDLFAMLTTGSMLAGGTSNRGHTH